MTRRQYQINGYAAHDSRFTKFLTGLLLLVFSIAASALEAQSFDHDNTLFPLDITHSRVSCESCHLQQVFKGTPTRCSSCHARGSRIQASAPSASHIPVLEDCSFCHQGPVWESVYRVDHFAVLGSCQSCHNGVISIGKNTGHIQSSNNCENCHRTNAWLNVIFDHSDIVANCQNCHNGTIATGKTVNHILTSDNCDDCHRTLSWIPVARVDHGSVIGLCSSCHNGVIAIGKPADHVVTTDECSACHVTTTWIGATANRAITR